MTRHRIIHIRTDTILLQPRKKPISFPTQIPQAAYWPNVDTPISLIFSNLSQGDDDCFRKCTEVFKKPYKNSRKSNISKEVFSDAFYKIQKYQMVNCKFITGTYVADQNTQRRCLFSITTQNLIGVEFGRHEVIST